MEDGESGVPLGTAVLDAKKREKEYVTIPHLQGMEPQNVRVAMAWKKSSLAIVIHGFVVSFRFWLEWDKLNIFCFFEIFILSLPSDILSSI